MSTTQAPWTEGVSSAWAENLLVVTIERPHRDESEERFQRRAAAAEINGRQVTEAIEPRGQSGESAVFVCECGHLGCSETVEIAIGESTGSGSG